MRSVLIFFILAVVSTCVAKKLEAEITAIAILGFSDVVKGSEFEIESDKFSLILKTI